MVNPEFKKFDFVVKGANGSVIETDKGKFIDFTGSGTTAGYNFLGKFQISTVSSIYFKTLHTLQLNQKLKKLSSFENVVYTTSGTEACESALTRFGLPVIGLEGAYHGRTYLAYWASNGRGIDREHRAVHLRIPDGDTAGVIEKNEEIMERASNEFNLQGATLIFELIQVDGGIRILPQEFIDHLFHLKKKYALRIAIDEVYTAFGRSGEILYFKGRKLKPDMVCLGKGMGGGMPMGAVLYNGKWDVPYGNAMGMQAGNSSSCEASLRVLESLSRERLRFVRKGGEEIRSILRDVRNDRVKEVRGVGFINGVDLGVDKKTSKQYSYKIREKLKSKGVVASLVGSNNDVLRIAPPVLIDEKTLWKGIGAIADVLEKN